MLNLTRITGVCRQRGGQRQPKTFLGFPAGADQGEKAKTERTIKADRQEIHEGKTIYLTTIITEEQKKAGLGLHRRTRPSVLGCRCPPLCRISTNNYGTSLVFSQAHVIDFPPPIVYYLVDYENNQKALPLPERRRSLLDHRN